GRVCALLPSERGTAASGCVLGGCLTEKVGGNLCVVREAFHRLASQAARDDVTILPAIYGGDGHANGVREPFLGHVQPAAQSRDCKSDMVLVFLGHMIGLHRPSLIDEAWEHALCQGIESGEAFGTVLMTQRSV